MEHKTLNEKQKECIEASNKPVMVIAGAGSGKTFVLTQRIIYLITKLGYYHNSILAFTFTNKAANEIKERINTLLPKVAFHWIGTFHSICLKILREDIKAIGRSSDFIILDEDDQLVVLREIYSTNELNKEIIVPRKVVKYISHLKSNKIDFNILEDVYDELKKFEFSKEKDELIALCYVKYCEYLIAKNLLDFDDLIIYANKVLSSSDELKEKWQSRFNYVLVDEFQDTNEDQFELINHLVKDRQNIFIVGDPDQMIYSWRGSYSNIFEDFEKLYPDHEKYILEKNYRSTQSILDVSNRLIANNKFRIEKNLFTDNHLGSNIIYYHAANADRESAWIVNKIAYLKERHGYRLKDIVVLYRSNYLSRNIEQALIYKNIPYVIFGGLKFFQRKEIKDIIAFLKVICFDDDVSLNRIYNTPKRRISEAIYAKILKYGVTNGISTWEAFLNINEIADLKPAAINNCKALISLIEELKEFKYITINDLVDKILTLTKYEEYLKEADEEYKMENILELKSSINLYQHNNPSSTLREYLQEITLYTSNEEKNSNFFNRDYVSLMTIHNAKGLEFKNVFIIGFCEGLFPSSKSIESGDISEERRIAYVAMTRARENLFITSYSGRNFHGSNGMGELLPSRFVEEISTSNNFESLSDPNLAPRSRSIFSDDNPLSLNKDFSENFHEEKQEYDLGDMVNHIVFGLGVVVAIENNTLKISFKSPYGTKFIARDHKSIKKIVN
ncbi:MAG: ATP-dependent helicase [Mycoplasmoidaceae bacterium]